LNLSSLSAIDANLSWFAFDQNTPEAPPDLSNEAQVQSHSWFCGHYSQVLTALNDEEFAENYKKSLWECLPYPGLSLPNGHADVFYVSSSQFMTFQKAAALFAKFHIWLEIAVPSISQCILREFKRISIYTTWDSSRGNAPPPGTEVDVIHPIKLSIPELYDYTVQIVNKM